MQKQPSATLSLQKKRNVFNKPVKDNLITCDNTQLVKEMITQLVNNYYKMIAIGLSERQAFDTDPNVMQQINSTANLDRVRNTRTFFIIEKVKETILEFLKGTVKVLQI